MRTSAGRASRAALALLVAISSGVAACGATDASPSVAGGPLITLTPTLQPPPPSVASPVAGLVIDIDTSGLTEVRSFTIRTDAGETIAFALDLEDETLFPPAHLAVHLADGYPVIVHSRAVDGTLVAYRIEDGTPPAT